jgi:Trypsin-co-occurring domain 2
LDLKEFIKATISAIAEATSELQEQFGQDGILINPPSAQSGSDVYQPKSRNYTMRRVQRVSFDVAVTAGTSTSGGGSGGIKVWSAEIGGKLEKSASDERVSRVQFEIPMTLKPSSEEAANMQLNEAEEKRSRDDRSGFEPRSIG